MEKVKVLSDKEEVEELKLAKECYFGIPAEEEGESLNDLQRKKIKRLLEKYGYLYGINVNLYKGYKEEPIFKIDKNTKLYNFLCDAVIPPTAMNEKELKELEEKIRKWNETVNKDILDEIMKTISEKGEHLLWY